jgi:hypothetical protein
LGLFFADGLFARSLNARAARQFEHDSRAKCRKCVTLHCPGFQTPHVPFSRFAGMARTVRAKTAANLSRIHRAEAKPGISARLWRFAGGKRRSMLDFKSQVAANTAGEKF